MPTLLVLSLVLGGPAAAQQLQSWQSKVEPGLRLSWQLRQERAASGLAAARREEFRRVIVTLESETAVEVPGLELLARRGNVATARLQLSRLPEAAASPAVRHLRGERRLHPVDDLGVLSLRAARVQPRLGLTGRGVLIGVIDTGLDWSHPDFRAADGRTRIAALLDLSTGPDSQGGGAPGSYGGKLFSREEIDRALQQGSTLGTADYVGHGTHCLGVAAASPSDNPFGINRLGGVAPEAELVGIKATSSPRDSTFSDFNILNGLAFLDSLARARRMPYVCNMSFGGSLGAHDGTSSFERFITGFTRNPGALIVAAAGNERQRSCHAAGSFAGRDSVVLELQVAGRGSRNDELVAEFWLSSGHPGLSLTVLAPDGTRFGPYPNRYFSDRYPITPHGVIAVENAPNGPDPESGDRLVTFALFDLAFLDEETTDSANAQIATGAWKLVLHSATGAFDAYLYATEGLRARFASHATELGTIAVPASAPQLISVGAYTSRVAWEPLEPGMSSSSAYFGGSLPGALTYFTSLGPNRKGVPKPELTAPGQWVLSSLSAQAWPLTEPLSIYVSPARGAPLLMVARDSLHAASQGTSFSAPHVAGLCALLLEADPGLNQARAKALLTATAARDSLTIGAPDNYWGHGRANAIGAVRAALGLSADSLLVAAVLDPPDTLRADSLYCRVFAELGGSSQLIRACSLTVRWPPELLRWVPLTGWLTAGESMAAELDTLRVGQGRLGVRLTAREEPRAENAVAELFRAAFVPRSAAPRDSVRVELELTSLTGDLAPLAIESQARLRQPGPLALRPSPSLARPGDVDRNQRQDIFDLLELLTILAGRGLAGPWSDLDADGRTDIFDLIALLRLLAG